jgi:cell fate regulator YaaT (PSP1 superfamily)
MDILKIVAVSFQNAGKIFDFNACELELAVGDKVIVETERGRALASVVTAPREEAPDSSRPKLKNVLRLANDADLEMAEKNAAREDEALQFCKRRAHERKMEMKMVRAEYLFDGSKIVFYFTADGRIDFRELVRDLAQHFRTRIEMRQIGVRDEAKMVGGLGVCGRELCCCTHLRSFAPVSVKMAKAQGLALNPSKISGQCGRLLCCLGYEYETYNELRKNLPKSGKKIELPTGPAEVVSVDILGQSVTVNENGQRRQVSLSELQGKVKQVPSNKELPAAEKTVRKKPAAAEQKDAASPADKKPNRRHGRRRNPAKPAGDGSDASRPEERRSNDRRIEDRDQKAQEKQPPKDELKDGKSNRPRRRRRRPRNRPKPPSQTDNNS